MYSSHFQEYLDSMSDEEADTPDWDGEFFDGEL